MSETKYTTRTVKVPLQLGDTARLAVFDTITQVRSLYKYVVQKCCAERCVNYYSMATPSKYREYRDAFPTIPSMLVQQMVKKACTNTRKWNDNHHGALWQYRGIRNAMSYPLNKRTASIRGNLLTFSTTRQRVRTLISIPIWFLERYNVNPDDIQAAEIILQDTGLYIMLQFRIPVNPTKHGAIMGVDRGLYNIYTLSDGTIISSKQAVAVKRRYQYLRSKLKQKGTRSAKRHLSKIKHREARFMADFNHCVTKQLASRTDVGTYVLEDLRGIRKRRKGKKLNSWLANWAYYQFELQLQYKCAINGIRVAFIDPRYTSQKCSVCGTIDKSSRKKSKFVCTSCGHTEHADVNAAKNIRDNYVRHRSEQGASTTQS